MAKRLLNIVEPGHNRALYYNADPATPATVIASGEWFTLDANGKAIAADETSQLAYWAVQGTDRPDVRDGDPGGLGGDPLQTGSITGIWGKFILEVDADSFNSGGVYAFGTPLTIKSKILDVAASGDFIVGRAMGAPSGNVLRATIDTPTEVALP